MAGVAAILAISVHGRIGVKSPGAVIRAVAEIVVGQKENRQQDAVENCRNGSGEGIGVQHSNIGCFLLLFFNRRKGLSK